MNAPLAVLQKIWGYPDFRPPQNQIIESVLAGNDVCAFLPTGGGKSLCFQVPAMTLEGICIVVSPLIALMQDQVKNLHDKGIKAELLQGGMSIKDVDRILDNCIYGNIKFLYLSPERLLQLLVQERIKAMNVCLIAVDEAHCISQWGHDFRPAYRNIQILRELKPKTNIIALTATATAEVQTDIRTLLEMKNPSIIKKSFKRENIAIHIQFNEDKRHELLQELKKVNGSSIVYVRNRKITNDLSLFLTNNGISAGAYNGGMPNEHRKKILADWLSEKTQTVVATNAFGMGIDKANVRKVIHFQLPESIESYYQEIGRCGRDGKASKAVLLYNQNDLVRMRKQFVEVIPKVENVKYIYEKLNSYFGIAYGDGSQESFDFNYYDFCKKYNLNTRLAYNTIELLDRLSVLTLSKNYKKKTNIQFIVNNKSLLRFLEINPKYIPLVQLILRTYGGIFDYAVAIDLNLIKQKINLSEAQILLQLKELEKQSLLTGKITKQDLSITFLVPKENERTINPLKKHINNYRESKINQVKAVVDFIKNSKQCRNQQLMRYFGEKSYEDCGQCSVCLGVENSNKLNESNSLEIANYIIRILSKSESTSKEIIDKKRYSKAEIIDGLRSLLDANRIILTPTNTFKLKKK
ncbi:MAG: RecQ family ATP-dependent DNA helicase [Bacteroidota bacterium]